MQKHHWQFRTLIFCLILLLYSIPGWTARLDSVALKENTPCDPVASRGGGWWHYYEQGQAYAAETSWQAAAAAFQAALQYRQRDQRSDPFYCADSRDYFPHRELGIAYFHLGNVLAAQRELATSLGMVETAKAKLYLNRVRQVFIQQNGHDKAAPRLLLHRPSDGLITQRSVMEVTGLAEDDTFLATLSINGQVQFIDLTTPRLAFTETIRLHDGPNPIDIVAEDVLGRQTHQRLTVHLDRHGPLVSLASVARLGMSSQQYVRVEGELFDHSPILSFRLGQQQVSLQSGPFQDFRVEVPVAPHTTFLSFEVADAAGNVTRGEIDLPPASVLLSPFDLP